MPTSTFTAACPRCHQVREITPVQAERFDLLFGTSTEVTCPDCAATVVARAEATWLKALAAAEAAIADDDIDATAEAEQATYDVYVEACIEAGICYTSGCTAPTEWCAYCDEHCENPEHLPHADN